jgi:hypothetical protein
MSAASNYLENKVLDHTLRNTAFSQPSALYLAVFKNTSGNAATNLEAGTLTDEISGNNYIRKSIAFNAASGGTSASTATVTFDAATGDWGTVTHIAIMDAETSGNVLYWGALTTSKLIESGDTLQFVANNITISLA